MDIIVKNLCKTYDHNQVLNHFSCTFREKKMTCIMGKSGIGKSTLLSILMGLEKADEGTVSGMEHQKISAIFQENRLFENLDAVTNIHITTGKTNPNHLKVSDPGQVEGNSVFTYLDAFCTDEHFEKYLPDYKNLDELKDHYRRGGLGDVKVKKFLNAVMQEELAPIRARRKELEKKIPEIYEILHKGSIEAEKVAAQTLKEVKDAMKINYFEDQQLIREQTARFAE